MSAAPSLCDHNPRMLPVACRCGCGEMVRPRNPSVPKSFVNKAHANRFNPRIRKQPHGYRSRHGGSGQRGEGA